MEQSGIELHCAPGATMSDHKHRSLNLFLFRKSLTINLLSPYPTPTYTPHTKEEETICV